MKSGLGQVRSKNTVFRDKKGHYKENLMSTVMEIFASIDKIFILGRSLSTRV